MPIASCSPRKIGRGCCTEEEGPFSPPLAPFRRYMSMPLGSCKELCSTTQGCAALEHNKSAHSCLLFGTSVEKAVLSDRCLRSKCFACDRQVPGDLESQNHLLPSNMDKGAVNSFQCICAPGFSGLLCDKAPSTSPTPAGHFSTAAPAGHSSTAALADLSSAAGVALPCMSAPCVNGGTCVTLNTAIDNTEHQQCRPRKLGRGCCDGSPGSTPLPFAAIDGIAVGTCKARCALTRRCLAAEFNSGRSRCLLFDARITAAQRSAECETSRCFDCPRDPVQPLTTSDGVTASESFECACAEGFSGSRCEITDRRTMTATSTTATSIVVQLPCNRTPCQNGAACVNVGHSFRAPLSTVSPNSPDTPGGSCSPHKIGRGCCHNGTSSSVPSSLPFARHVSPTLSACRTLCSLTESCNAFEYSKASQVCQLFASAMITTKMSDGCRQSRCFSCDPPLPASVAINSVAIVTNDGFRCTCTVGFSGDLCEHPVNRTTETAMAVDSGEHCASASSSPLCVLVGFLELCSSVVGRSKCPVTCGSCGAQGTRNTTLVPIASAPSPVVDNTAVECSHDRPDNVVCAGLIAAELTAVNCFQDQVLAAFCPRTCGLCPRLTLPPALVPADDVPDDTRADVLGQTTDVIGSPEGVVPASSVIVGAGVVVVLILASAVAIVFRVTTSSHATTNGVSSEGSESQQLEWDYASRVAEIFPSRSDSSGTATTSITAADLCVDASTDYDSEAFFADSLCPCGGSQLLPGRRQSKPAIIFPKAPYEIPTPVRPDDTGLAFRTTTGDSYATMLPYSTASCSGAPLPAEAHVFYDISQSTDVDRVLYDNRDTIAVNYPPLNPVEWDGRSVSHLMFASPSANARAEGRELYPFTVVDDLPCTTTDEVVDDEGSAGGGGDGGGGGDDRRGREYHGHPRARAQARSPPLTTSWEGSRIAQKSSSATSTA